MPPKISPAMIPMKARKRNSVGTSGGLSQSLDGARDLIERNPALSPWVAPGELASTPVLELWPPGQGPHDLPRTAQGWGWQIVGPVDAPLP